MWWECSAAPSPASFLFIFHDQFSEKLPKKRSVHLLLARIIYALFIRYTIDRFQMTQHLDLALESLALVRRVGEQVA